MAELDYYLQKYGHRSLSLTITEANKNFGDDCLRLTQFLYFIFNLVLLDRISPVKFDPSLFGQEYKERTEFVSKLFEATGRNEKESQSFDSYTPLLAEFILCRAVDGFLTYLSALLSLIFRTKPETLKSAEQERVDFILQFQTMEEFITALAERRVNKLSYGGMRELAKYFEEKLGLKLTDTQEQLEAAVRLIEIRNIIVHNRGFVNGVFAKRVPDFSTPIGSRIKLELLETLPQAIYLVKLADQIDFRAVEKFNLPTISTGLASKD
jgi:hypothetical protein